MNKENDITPGIEALHASAKEMMKAKLPKEVIIDKLTARGLEPYYAKMILDNLENDKSDKRNFRITLLAGLILIIAGIILNVLSYRIAEKTGSLMFYCFWGIIVSGMLLIARAFILFRK